MAPIDVYLSRLSFWLPLTLRHQVVAETRRTLNRHLAMAASTAARPLTNAEIKRELIAFGRPAVVAARYNQGVPVMSGMLSAAYWRALTVALVAVVFVQLLVVLAQGSFSNPALSDALVRASGRAFSGALAAFAAVTLIFFLLSRGLRADVKASA